MHMTLPSGRTGQTIALLLLLAVAAAGWLLLLAPLADLYDSRNQYVERQREQVAHLKALVDALPSLRAELEANPPPPAATLPGATDSMAAAALQAAIQDMAGRVGAALNSVEIIPPDSTDGFHRIGLKVILSGNMRTITGLLLAIEQAQPPILVDDLEIHSDPMPAADRTQPPETRLEAGFAAYGFRQLQPVEPSP